MFNWFTFLILWMGIMYLVFHYIKTEGPLEVLGKTEMRTLLWAAILVVIPLLIMTRNRGNIGDTYVYRNNYNKIPDGFSEMLAYASKSRKDAGFTYLGGLIKVLTHASYQNYFLILAVIQVSSLIYIYRRYSINYVLSFFLFISSADYISWMFNGVRQFMAVTFIFAGFTLLMKKKYILYCALVIFASLFHRSALMMIPIMFIVSGEPWNRKTIIMLFMVLLVVLYVEFFTDILDLMLEETQYENVVSDWKSWKDDGTNPFRVMVYCIPAIISFFGRNHIAYKNDPVINVCTNMSIVTASIYLVSMVTSGIFIGRLPIYTSLYSYILLPWEIEHIFSPRSKKLIYVLLIICYLLYYYYQIHVTSHLIFIDFLFGLM